MMRRPDAAEVPLTLNLVREQVGDLYPEQDRDHAVSTTPSTSSAMPRCSIAPGSVANYLAGIGVGARHARRPLAWNSHRHLELYLAVPCMGAVLHTINARAAGADIARFGACRRSGAVRRPLRSGAPSAARSCCPLGLRHVVIMEDDIDPSIDPPAPMGTPATPV